MAKRAQDQPEEASSKRQKVEGQLVLPEAVHSLTPRDAQIRGEVVGITYPKREKAPHVFHCINGATPFALVHWDRPQEAIRLLTVSKGNQNITDGCVDRCPLCQYPWAS